MPTTKSFTENQIVPSTVKEENNLFPVFLKLEQMKILIVGGGKVALEKLHAVLYNSPSTKIKIVAISLNKEITLL
ncbi:MAG TPA: NAD(P)-dependent oxidoreductase, partial [Segetibacter sp.]|nr:NAD(P)-dependent oxidoreductase [Segetibacter sp.]